MDERLTYWNEEYGCWSYKCASGDAAKRLAAYEDSGLSPEEVTKVIKSGVPEWIDKYLEYRKLEADGRLVAVTQGEWLQHTNVTSKCSICGGLYSPFKYCPNCGAKMAREAAEKAIAEVGE